MSLGRALGGAAQTTGRDGSRLSAAAGVAAASLTWDAVIIDEACQATEVSTLVALAAATATRSDGRVAGSPPTLVLVGDPQQLPATVISQRAMQGGMDRSLFERLLAVAADGGTTLSDVAGAAGDNSDAMAAPAGAVASAASSARGVGLPRRPLFGSWRPTSIGGYFLLDTQYRMHPQIRHFPGAEFYGGRLQDGRILVPFDAPPAAGQTAEAPDAPLFHEPALYASEVFGPVRFFDVVPLAAPRSPYENPAEARVIARLAISLFMAAVKAPMGGRAGGREAKLDLRGKVGVITPYRKQVGVVRDALRDDLDHGGTSDRSKSWVRVATVDGFQGQEQEVILLSCVRTSRSRDGRGGIGFLREQRRLNVALTRAKCAVLIVGDANWLSRHDATWARLIDYCRTTGVIWKVADSTRTQVSSSAQLPSWSRDSIWASLGARMAGWV